MVKQSRKRKSTKKHSRKSTKARKRSGLFFQLLKRFAFWSILGFIFVVLTYIGYQDYSVRLLFEGKRWSLPARVYASPLELYSGYEINAADFEKTLAMLRYRKDFQLSTEASYHRKGRQITIKTRQFQFWDKLEPSRVLRLRFSRNRLQDIRDLKQSAQVPLVRLDPVQIGSFFPSRKEDRILIKLEQVPEHLIQALLAVEDRDFYNHHGLSFKGIFRALWANLRAGSIVQGGSTITQQLVKNLYLNSDRNLWRKMNEAIIALILEVRYSKNEILEAYLNEVYLGQDRSRAIHGFGLASRYYFDRSFSELQLHHVALLVVLVRGPSFYDPTRSPKRVLVRRNHVLDAMKEQEYITLKQANKAKLQPLSIANRTVVSISQYPAFLELVRRQLRQQYRDQDLTSEGLRIFTMLDTGIQQKLEDTLLRQLKRLEKSKGVKQLEAAAIITRREGGEIVALVGGRRFRYAGFNRAIDAVRPIGSLIKPAVYLTALAMPDKYTITTLINDETVSLKDSKGNTWTPKNYDHEQHGPVALHTALTNSYNLATVHLGLDVGVARIAKTIRDMGVRRELPIYPSTLLGAAPMSPFDVTQMYQTLAGDGFATPLRAIQSVISNKGKPLQRYALTIRQAIDPAATFITNRILQEVMREGTGKSAYATLPEHFNVAGKTGTTNDLRDSWFAGFSGDYLGVVWLGRDDNRSAGLSGARGALSVWTDLISKISTQPVDLILPDSIEIAWIDSETGLRGNELCQYAVEYPYVTGSAPSEISPCVETPFNKVRTWLDQLFEAPNSYNE